MEVWTFVRTSRSKRDVSPTMLGYRAVYKPKRTHTFPRSDRVEARGKRLTDANPHFVTQTKRQMCRRPPREVVGHR